MFNVLCFKLRLLMQKLWLCLLWKLKTPGPDGFSVEFFKKAWSIVGQDVIVAIRNFFQYGKLLKATNATIITLVPKKVNPSKMRDFRPISCCNLIYKCITKILMNQLVSCLEDLISLNQTTFIPNRSIAENVLLAQEVMKNYHKSGGTARCIMKVDLMKAYDSVNWDFALHSLCCFCMPGKFVSWVRECITSPWFLVAVNECVVKNEGFGYHHCYSKVGLTHLYFVDDLLIFSEASVRSNGQWYWSTAHSNHLVNIQSRLCMVPIGDEDNPKWNVSKTGMFSCSDTWDSIRVKENVVDWNRNALRHNNNSCTEEKLIQHIKWEVRIGFSTKGRFKKTRGNDILCSAWGIDMILV
ncbi:hypothetical protein Dsin_013433 [Dipteronia sinensis]|uniref:Reverse transcriptase domain-containing protein n=1 Tax=Dipteronia sinensis TaxID=43782 RepID=A0AAE0AJZ3_9ROSI|nr:hypothetical protein Dsin_013433 [Dipteronia sinensis]